MSRLEKKCFFGSAGVHGLLALILLVGPAFVSSKSSPENLPPIDFIPSILVDAAVAGGGNPNARPPSAQPPAPQPQPPPPVALPQPQPQPQPQPEPEPEPKKAKAAEPELPKETVKETKNNQPDPDSLEATKQPTRKKPNISLTKVTRNGTKSDSKKKADAEAKAQDQRLASLRQLGNRLSTTADKLSGGASSTAVIEDYGPGGGGPAYASYKAYVKSVYENAWLPPEDTATDDAVIKATVTIARDGNVVTARISRPSGDAPADRSVRNTLDRVKYIAPFPDGVREKERTYTIEFNLKAKRGSA